MPKDSNPRYNEPPPPKVVAPTKETRSNAAPAPLAMSLNEAAYNQQGTPLTVAQHITQLSERKQSAKQPEHFRISVFRQLMTAGNL